MSRQLCQVSSILVESKGMVWDIKLEVMVGMDEIHLGHPGGGPPSGGPPGGGHPGGGPPSGPPGGNGPGGFYNPNGFPGGFPGGPPGGGPPGDPWGPGGGFAGQMPWWMMVAQQESVRPVELPTLAELTETEVGPLVAGDWLVTITPFMRDISSSSSAWWDQVMRTAEDAYRRWLDADPMARLRMTLTVRDSFQRAPWLRVEQRGSVALLKAIPETIRSELIAQREVGSIHIIFKVLRARR